MSMSDTKLIRLVTGEELLAKHVEGNTYKDLAIIIPQGGGNLGIMQYTPYAKIDKITFREDHIMFVVEPKQELINEYNKVYGSGLVMATAGDKARLKM